MNLTPEKIHKLFDLCPVCSIKLPAVLPPYCPHCGCLIRPARGRILRPDQVRLVAQAIKQTGYTPIAFELVFTAFGTACGKKYKPSPGQRQVSDDRICEAVCEMVLFRFDTEAANELDKLGLRTTQDIGNIVRSIIDVGMASQEKKSDHWKTFSKAIPLRNMLTQSVNRWRGLCTSCGYDLRGSPSGVCPECGHQH